MAVTKKHYLVKCLNETVHGKGGAEVGEILIDPMNRVQYLSETGLVSARKRFDGSWGFECMCGNDSRIAASEEGVLRRARPSVAELQKAMRIGQITANAPSKGDMAKIAKNNSIKPTKVKETDEYIEVDGFRLVKQPDVIE